MSLSSAARIAQSGLNTATSEISVVSRNISGVSDTSTFNRKIAVTTTTASGGSTVSVARAQDNALFENVLGATSAAATQSALSTGLTTLNNIEGDTTSSTSPAALLSSFTDALQSYEAAPSDANLATGAVAAARSLAQGLNSATATVQGVRETADSEMSAAVTTINSLLSQFQSVNTQITQGTALGADVSDLQDQRDTLLTQLSQQIGITTTTGPNNDMSIYTDSGVTLFEKTARTVSFSPTSTYTSAVTGNAVLVDGVSITGSSATMPISSGALAGLATLRDSTTVTFQDQLDQMAGALISNFAETDTSTNTQAPGLFTDAGSATLPTTTSGLAGSISIAASVDPSQGGQASLLRDGGIAGSAYASNTTGAASYATHLQSLLTGLNQTLTFSPTGGITTSATLSDYASASDSWLQAQRSSVSSSSSYQSALLSTATTALSNSTGVNLDDEMSKMLDLENSYGSSAKLVQAIDSMFTSLLGVIGT